MKKKLKREIKRAVRQARKEIKGALKAAKKEIKALHLSVTIEKQEVRQEESGNMP